VKTDRKCEHTRSLIPHVSYSLSSISTFILVVTIDRHVDTHWRPNEDAELL
jgi:hypothetical protein